MFEILQYRYLVTVLTENKIYGFKVHAIINPLKIDYNLNPYYWKIAKHALDTYLNSDCMHENERLEVITPKKSFLSFEEQKLFQEGPSLLLILSLCSLSLSLSLYV
jgi:hypothetical protein